MLYRPNVCSSRHGRAGQGRAGQGRAEKLRQHHSKTRVRTNHRYDTHSRMQKQGTGSHLSWQQHIQQISGSREAATQGVPRFATAHVHLVGLLLHFVSAQVDQPQHNDAAFCAAETHVAPVCGVHLDAGESMLCSKILAPQH